MMRFCVVLFRLVRFFTIIWIDCGRRIYAALLIICVIAIDNSIAQFFLRQTAFWMAKIFTFFTLERAMLFVRKVTALINTCNLR